MEFLKKESPFEGQYPDGHPVRVYLEENILIREYIEALRASLDSSSIDEFKDIFAKLGRVEYHFARKENQLFPYLEKYNWTSPSQNMWAFHDQIREEIKGVRAILNSDDHSELAQMAYTLFNSLEHILQVEEGRLLPNAMGMLTKEDWEEFRDGDAEIGWVFDTPPATYPPIKEEYIHPSLDTKKRKLPFSIDEATHYDEGYLTPAQVNSIFRILPVDITYVNENDQVVFYNRGEDRVFPRSAGIIG